MTAKRALLDLQAADLRVERARRRIAELDAAAEVVEASRGVSDATAGLESATAALDEARVRRSGAERAAESAGAATAKAASSLATATDPRLIASFEREVEAAEAKELEALEAYEEADSVLDACIADHTAAVEAVTAAEASLDVARSRQQAQRREAGAELDEAVADAGSARDQVPADLLDTYDTLRAARGGVVAARFEGGTCGACNMHLSAVEVDQLLHDGPGVLTCPECGAMLVRGD